MGMISEFKDFAAGGNMVDMAVGIVIGAAFGTVIKSLVDDLLMPIVSSVFSLPDFSQLYMPLKETATAKGGMALEAFREAGGVALAWGNFINALLAYCNEKEFIIDFGDLCDRDMEFKCPSYQFNARAN